jgi:hypothetical protein
MLGRSKKGSGLPMFVSQTMDTVDMAIHPFFVKNQAFMEIVISKIPKS